jgi:hypothetical protein
MALTNRPVDFNFRSVLAATELARSRIQKNRDGSALADSDCLTSGRVDDTPQNG